MSFWQHPLSIWKRISVILTPFVVKLRTRRCHLDNIWCQVENASVSFWHHSWSSWQYSLSFGCHLVSIPFGVDLTPFGIDFTTYGCQFENMLVSIRDRLVSNRQRRSFFNIMVSNWQRWWSNSTTFVVKKLTMQKYKIDHIRCQFCNGVFPLVYKKYPTLIKQRLH